MQSRMGDGKNTKESYESPNESSLRRGIGASLLANTPNMALGESTFSAQTVRNSELLSGQDAGTGSRAKSSRLPLVQ